MASEVVTYWLGQCGVQLGDASWELICLEHEMGPDGKFFSGRIPEDQSFRHFFHEGPNGQYVPRTCFIDFEPNVVDEIRTGVYRKLFHPDYIINTYEDASSNFARAFYSCGRLVIRYVVAATRKIAETCDKIQAFVVNHSYGGGTGSGFSSLLMEFLAVEYSKTSKLQFGVFPSPTLSTSVVEPYNAALSLHSPMENSDLAMFMDNEALFNLCHYKLNIQQPVFTNLNRLEAQVFSGLTASFRFEGPCNAKLTDLQTNLVPYPRIHFPLVSYAPVESPAKAAHDSLSVKEITQAVFTMENQLVVVDPSLGTYMSCVVLYRGDISTRDIAYTLTQLKDLKKLTFVDWCPTGFKTGINYQPMTLVPPSGMAFSSKSVTMLMNTTAIRHIVTSIDRKFLLLFNKRAFVHWYVAEGMEETEFNEAYDDLMTLEQDLVVIEESTGKKDNDESNYLPPPSIRSPPHVKRVQKKTETKDNYLNVPSTQKTNKSRTNNPGNTNKTSGATDDTTDISNEQTSTKSSMNKTTMTKPSPSPDRLKDDDSSDNSDPPELLDRNKLFGDFGDISSSEVSSNNTTMRMSRTNPSTKTESLNHTIKNGYITEHYNSNQENRLFCSIEDKHHKYKKDTRYHEENEEEDDDDEDEEDEEDEDDDYSNSDSTSRINFNEINSSIETDQEPTEYFGHFTLQSNRRTKVSDL